MTNFSLTKDQFEGLMALLHQSQAQFASVPTPNQDKHYTNHLTTNTSAVHISPSTTSPSGTILALHLEPHINLWILDSGATDHICSSLDLFIAHKTIKPVSIRLPNGSQVMTHITGIVCFSSTFVLHNVLYLPSFSFNLISVSKLTSSLNCTLSFSDKHCDIQDRTSLMKIGAAEVVDGLYVMKHFVSK